MGGAEVPIQNGQEFNENTNRALAAIGHRIRELRKLRGMTLQQLAEICNLSSSMLSLVERGIASPSIGSLIVVSDALGTTMSDLTAATENYDGDPVTRASQAKIVRTTKHVTRRLMKEDRTRGVSIAVNEYAPNTGSSDRPLHHDGYEYGLVLDGELTVEIEGNIHILKPGDLIAYSSKRDHRLWNHGKTKTRTVWFNLNRD